MQQTNVNAAVKTLTLNEYLPLALKTKADLGSLENDYIHSISGLFTEVGELVDAFKRHWFYKKDLDRVNLKEEIGDILWYVAIGLHALGQTSFPAFKRYELLEDPEAPDDRFVIGKLVTYSAQATSQGYCSMKSDEEDDWKTNFDYSLNNLVSFLDMFAVMNGTSLEEAAYLNIIKLAKRYPEGFSEFNALNRDTVNELSHIEG